MNKPFLAALLVLCWALTPLSALADSDPAAEAEAPEEEALVSEPSPPVSPNVPASARRTFRKSSQQKRSSKKAPAPSDHKVQMDGRYRLAAAADSEKTFILNDSNADLQERNFRYLSGERLNNTFDPKIYDQLLLNVNFDPADRWNVYTQIVADPWSYVGTTGEQIQRSALGSETMRYNLKYFGAFNSTLNETYRTNVADSYSFPIIKVHEGQTTPTVIKGFTDFNPGTNGIPFNIPALDIDYEFRPLRKLWVDTTGDEWRARMFALADETQALWTDDPLELSNHKNYWQQSPWLYQYTPLMFFTDGSVKRGHYSDSLSFLARDSEGNRLILLRGASIEADLDRAHFAATVAAPFTPWDEKYFAADNIPGAMRLKYRVTDRLTMGSTYTFRSGLIDNGVADMNQVLGIDGKYNFNENITGKAEAANSYRDRDQKTHEALRARTDGFAYKAVLESHTARKNVLPGLTDVEVSFTQMDVNFDPNLSTYVSTRDDTYWGKHLTFKEYSPDLEHFRIGDGVDVNRRVYRLRWKENSNKGRIVNLADLRHVRTTNENAYKESVVRDELTLRVTGQLALKGLFRWHHLPKSYAGIEPFLAGYTFQGDALDRTDQTYENVRVPAGADPSRFTASGGAQYILNKHWTLEGFVEVTNDVPDFPRVLLASTFRGANDRIEGILTDHVQTTLYGQGPLGGKPPYEYFTITRQRVIFKPDGKTVVILHAAQNGYKYAAGIDDNINHIGASVAVEATKTVDFFMDYTYSHQIDVPKLIATDYTEHDFRGHHNVYASMDYRRNQGMVWRAEYGVFGLGDNTPLVTPYSVSTFSLPTVDTEHLLRLSLNGEF